MLDKSEGLNSVRGYFFTKRLSARPIHFFGGDLIQQPAVIYPSGNGGILADRERQLLHFGLNQTSGRRERCPSPETPGNSSTDGGTPAS